VVGAVLTFPSAWLDFNPGWDCPEELRIFDAGLAKGTWSNYTSVMRQWCHFLHWSERRVLPPVQEADLRAFVVFRCVMQSRPIQGSSLPSNFSALHKWHDVHGYEWRCYTARVKQMVQGARNLFDKPTREMWPWKWKLLVALFRSFDASVFDQLVYATGFAFAYFFILRPSEWTARKAWAPPMATTLQIRDLGFRLRDGSVWEVKFNLPRAKTDQANKGRDMFRGRSGAEVCVVSLLDKMLSQRFGSVRAALQHPTAFLFAKSSGAVLTYKECTGVLRSFAKSAKLDDSRYSLYSLRRGAASQAFANGISIPEIKAIGGWKSAAVMHYITSDPEWVVAASLGLSRKIRSAKQVVPKEQPDKNRKYQRRTANRALNPKNLVARVVHRLVVDTRRSGTISRSASRRQVQGLEG